MFAYWRKPQKRNSWGGPFNNQIQRQRIFKDLVDEIPFEFIVETGTYRGTTTEFMHQESGLDVHSVEAKPRNYGFALMRFASNRRVHVGLGDSREFLRGLVISDLVADRPVFFYLDAHWGEDLPLAEELDLIFGHWPCAVVMVDDFRVPDDEGYSYDDYGPGKVLEIDYLERAGHGRLARLFPTAPASEESGKRRGSVVLASDADVLNQLEKVESLRRML